MYQIAYIARPHYTGMSTEGAFAVGTRSLSSSVPLFALFVFLLAYSILIAIGLSVGTADATYPTIKVGPEPLGIAFDPFNGDWYVTIAGDSKVLVISGQTNTVIGTPIAVGGLPRGIAFDSLNGDLYVTNQNNNTVTVISGQTNTVIDSPLPVGHEPTGIAFDSLNGD